MGVLIQYRDHIHIQKSNKIRSHFCKYWTLLVRLLSWVIINSLINMSVSKNSNYINMGSNKDYRLWKVILAVVKKGLTLASSEKSKILRGHFWKLNTIFVTKAKPCIPLHSKNQQIALSFDLNDLVIQQPTRLSREQRSIWYKSIQKF